VEKKTEAKKRGRPRKQNLEILEKKQTENKSEKKPEGVTTRSKAKKKLEHSEQAENVNFTKPIEDVSFARHTEINVNDPYREDELRSILLATINKEPLSYEEAMMQIKKIG